MMSSDRNEARVVSTGSVPVPPKLRKWQVTRRELLFDAAPWVELWRETILLPDGRELDDYYQIEQRDFVVIAAWRDGKVFGLWGYKHGPRQVTLGLPAGYIEKGEEAAGTARRELREEAMLISEEWQHVGSYCVDGNRSTARAHFFVALNCQPTEPCPSDDLEEKLGEWLTPEEWRDCLVGGKIRTLGAAMAVHAGILAFMK
jgi:ADP-ribose pyrophosphatase